MLVHQHGLDTAVDAIFSVNWAFYSDLTEHTIQQDDREMVRTRRQTIARWVLFLRTNTPYEHPHGSCVSPDLLLCTTICLGSFVGAIGWMASMARISISACLVTVLAYSVVWVRGGVALDRIASRLAFTSPTRDFWPFVSAKQLGCARDTPTFLTGVEHKNSPTA